MPAVSQAQYRAMQAAAHDHDSTNVCACGFTILPVAPIAEA